jgi:broad specificity phosphatase PhoE
MAKFYLVRHGKADYSYAEKTGHLAVFSNLAPLHRDYIYMVDETAKDKRLADAEIIIASPYTRALQTASIISKKTGIDIIVEPDLMEWQEDLSYTFNSFDMQNKYIEEYIRGDYSHCESRQHLRDRVMSVLKRYKKYKKVIVVFHCMAILAVTDLEREIANAEIIEFEI